MRGSLAGQRLANHHILQNDNWMGSLGRSFLQAFVAFGLLLALTAGAAAGETAEIKAGYLRRAEQPPAISLLDVPAPDAGLAGAELAIADNNTTGRFLNQKFSITDVKLGPDEDPAAAVQKLAGEGISLVVTDLPADALLKAADAGRARGMLFFNAGALSDALREEDCRADVIHVAPTRSMLADGLGQYLVWKQWLKWVLVTGSHPDDKLWADALKRAALRFGAKIAAEKVFEDKGGARQTDSGIAEIQLQIPLFTQGLPDHDVLIAADESAVFAAYLPYRTKAARPVAGSAGLMPTSWDPSMEQWGATQLQNRFMKRYSRRMQALDMQAWTAVRMIGEAVTRTNSADTQQVRDFILGPSFELAAFKGQALTVRPWNCSSASRFS